MMKWMNKLSRREQYSVGLGLAFLGIFMVLQLGIFPLNERKNRLQSQVRQRKTAILDIQLLQSEYKKIKIETQQWESQIKRRSKSFTLFSFMERLAKEAKADIAYMKPSKSKSKQKDFPYFISKVEIKLQEIDLKQLTNYLYKLETSANMIFVQRVSITKKEKKNIIDVIIQAETFEA